MCAADHVVRFTRPSPSIFAYCKRSKTGAGEGLGTRLRPPSAHLALCYNHIWKLVGFVYPLCGFNYPFSIPTGVQVLYCSKPISFTSLSGYAYVKSWIVHLDLIPFVDSFHCMNCTTKMTPFCKYWTLVCRLVYPSSVAQVY